MKFSELNMVSCKKKVRLQIGAIEYAFEDQY